MHELSGLKVVFLAGTLGQGGAERQLFYIVAALKNAGAQPRVLSLTNGEFWEKRIKSIGVEVTWVGQSRFRALRLMKIVRELRRDRPDVIQSQHFYTNIYVAVAARILGLPEIGALRNDAIEELTSNPGFLGRRSLTMPRAIAANSNTGIQNAVRMGAARERLHPLPNVVDTALFKPRSEVRQSPVRLLMVARLVPAKRVDRFISLMSELRQRTKQSVEAVVAGDGILRRELEEQTKESALDAGVFRFIGRVSETSELYHDADILVVTSDREGTPNSVLEAMASGLPVVATRAGGVADLVCDGETGYIIEPGDEKTLLTAVLSLIEDPATRVQFGVNARARVEKHYALDLLPQHLLHLYEAVLAPELIGRKTHDMRSTTRIAESSGN